MWAGWGLGTRCEPFVITYSTSDFWGVLVYIEEISIWLWHLRLSLKYVTDNLSTVWILFFFVTSWGVVVLSLWNEDAAKTDFFVSSPPYALSMVCPTSSRYGQIDDYWPSVILHQWLKGSSHQFLDVVVYHPILDDSSHPYLDVVVYHPILDDSSHSFLSHLI